MLIVKQTLMATDQNGDEVLIAKGDVITEIEDAGPVESREYEARQEQTTGWNVTCRFTPRHKLWTEIVTCDAIKLLKALE